MMLFVVGHLLYDIFSIRVCCRTTFLSLLAELQRARELTWVMKKIGNPSNRENLVMTSPYHRPFSVQTLEEERIDINQHPTLLKAIKIPITYFVTRMVLSSKIQSSAFRLG